jgi:hypothetical protein
MLSGFLYFFDWFNADFVRSARPLVETPPVAQ